MTEKIFGKESRLWLRLIESGDIADSELNRLNLIDESEQLMKIFGSLICKNKSE